MLSRYLKIYPCPAQPGHFLLYSTRKGSLIRVSADLLAAAREGRLPEREEAVLRRLELLVGDPAAEREAMRSLLDRANARKNRFRGIVVLTLDCNLACPYCYEEGFRGRHAMAAETAELLVEWAIREQLGRDRDVQLDFYGGEPLLSLPRLKEIARRLQEAAQAQGRIFSFSLVTNGTLLTAKVVEELMPLGLTGASVTVDGPREVHDRQRPFVSGRGSFDAIVANIAETWALIELRVGGNCTPENYREFPRILDDLLRAGVEPDRMGVVNFTPVVPKAGEKASADTRAGCLSSSEPWLREAALYFREEILRRGFKAGKPTQAACMVEFEHDLVVNYDGSLYKCPAFMGWPELSVGTLAAGVSDYAASHNLALWHNDECLDCAYLPLCFGGCRYLTLLKTGGMNEVDCRREFYDATLEGMIRQDMRWGQKGEAGRESARATARVAPTKPYVSCRGTPTARVAPTKPYVSM